MYSDNEVLCCAADDKEMDLIKGCGLFAFPSIGLYDEDLADIFKVHSKMLIVKSTLLNILCRILINLMLAENILHLYCLLSV